MYLLLVLGYLLLVVTLLGVGALGQVLRSRPPDLWCLCLVVGIVEGTLGAVQLHRLHSLTVVQLNGVALVLGGHVGLHARVLNLLDGRREQQFAVRPLVVLVGDRRALLVVLAPGRGRLLFTVALLLDPDVDDALFVPGVGALALGHPLPVSDRVSSRSCARVRLLCLLTAVVFLFFLPLRFEALQLAQLLSRVALRSRGPWVLVGVDA